MLKQSCFILITLLLSSVIHAEEKKSYMTTRVISTAMAIEAATVAEQTCSKMGYQVSVAVVDRYGNLVSFARNPLSGAHTITISQDKAYTAATFQGDTIALADRLNFLKGTPRLSLVGGGVPIKIAGYMYGAIGISGAPAKKNPGDVDHECAMAGVNAVREAIEFGE
ncbi:MAG: heme-binding protein [Thioalkalispiraceae bacterium]|jgi:uncharacterized protein GlcG (DUF336 family)